MAEGKTKVTSFDINYSQCLDEAGQLSDSPETLVEQGIDEAMLMDFYRWMQLARTFDTKTIALQRTGRLGTYASCLGQEAIGAAIGKAMQQEDVFVQAYRETAALFIRGVKPEEILLYWGGDERGMDFTGPKEDAPYAVPIASQCCHAVGISYALKLRQQPRATVVVCGDGGTSKGDFYESLNAAGVWQLPLVFIVNNNQWAISVPRSIQSHSETLAQKAIAAGISCEQVDGNDVLGCYLQIRKAVERARQGQGPHLIEALTYRLSDHTTADDASRYQDEEAVKEAWLKEPIVRLKKLLLSEQLLDFQKTDEQMLSEDQLAEIEQWCSKEVEQAIERYLNMAPQPPEAMFQYLYAELPDLYRDQWEELKAVGEKSRQQEEGDDA